MRVNAGGSRRRVKRIDQADGVGTAVSETAGSGSRWHRPVRECNDVEWMQQIVFGVDARRAEATRREVRTKQRTATGPRHDIDRRRWTVQWHTRSGVAWMSIPSTSLHTTPACPSLAVTFVERRATHQSRPVRSGPVRTQPHGWSPTSSSSSSCTRRLLIIVDCRKDDRSFERYRL
jgi:hypothetical protein